MTKLVFSSFHSIDYKHLKNFQHSFVVTYMDKCSNNFVFINVKHYVASIFNEISSFQDT
jgi:hypothetical protein